MGSGGVRSWTRDFKTFRLLRKIKIKLELKIIGG